MFLLNLLVSVGFFLFFAQTVFAGSTGNNTQSATPTATPVGAQIVPVPQAPTAATPTTPVVAPQLTAAEAQVTAAPAPVATTPIALVKPVARVVSESGLNTNKHIRELSYSPNKIYKIVASQGYTTAIELGNDEKVLSVNVGDSSAWLVNVQNNVINLKPIVDNPTTNMNVISDRGSYQFLLTALPAQRDAAGQLIRQPDDDALFVLRFRYDDGDAAGSAASGIIPAPPVRNNYSYTARGDAAVAPISVYDNGRFTFFDFGDRQDIPAIFVVDRKGHESLVNYHLQGKFVVVEVVGQQFTLRNDKQVASIFNEAAR